MKIGLWSDAVNFPSLPLMKVPFIRCGEIPLNCSFVNYIPRKDRKRCGEQYQSALNQ